MSFIMFFIYLTICIFIYGIIGVLIYKFFIKKKSNDDNTLNFNDLIYSVSSELNNNYDKDFWSDKKDFKVKEYDENDKKVYSGF